MGDKPMEELKKLAEIIRKFAEVEFIAIAIENGYEIETIEELTEMLSDELNYSAEQKGDKAMKQYCRYCAHAHYGDVVYCDIKNIIIQETTAKRVNTCKDFGFNEIDVFSYGDLDKKYKPREPTMKQCEGQIRLFQDNLIPHLRINTKIKLYQLYGDCTRKERDI